MNVNMNMVILSWDRTGNLHWERSLNVVLRLCRLRTVRCRLAWLRLCNWPHATVSLRPRLVHHVNGRPRTGSGEMARVACTLVAKGWIGGVLCSRVALDLVTFWRIRVKVDICRFESCICRVVRDPQLGIIGSNRRCSSVMETQINCPAS
jgi:hypothetical protein